MVTDSGRQGPGVRSFLEAHAAGGDIDVAAIVREHPGEALAVADAIREVAAMGRAAARVRMWRARARVLGAAGEDMTLGTLLRDFRRDARLTTTDLSGLVRARGMSLHPDAIERLEENEAHLGNVGESLWAALAEILGIDRHLLFVAVEGAAGSPRPARRFTRMAREATAADREATLQDAARAGSGEDAAYLERVWAALGLPGVIP